MSFEFKKLNIPEVVLIKPKVINDERGFFMETYHYIDFADFGIKDKFLQDNHSYSVEKGTLRGLHYQKRPMAQAKLIRVIKGRIFDAAVDIRTDSPAYGKYVTMILSAEDKAMIYIPEGFAHGFCTLEDETEIIYKCSNVYSPEHERGIIWNDKEIGIKWPLNNPILSPKDRNLPSLTSSDTIL